MSSPFAVVAFRACLAFEAAPHPVHSVMFEIAVVTLSISRVLRRLRMRLSFPRLLFASVTSKATILEDAQRLHHTLHPSNARLGPKTTHQTLRLIADSRVSKVTADSHFSLHSLKLASFTAAVRANWQAFLSIRQFPQIHLRIGRRDKKVGTMMNLHGQR